MNIASTSTVFSRNFADGRSLFLGEDWQDRTRIRQHQRDALVHVIQRFDRYKNLKQAGAEITPDDRKAWIVLPTGTGKSVIAVLCCYCLGIRRAAFLTPGAWLTKQILNDFCGKFDLESPDAMYTNAKLYKYGVVAMDTPATDVIPPAKAVASSKHAISSDVMTSVLVAYNVHRISERTAVRLSDTRFNRNRDFVIIDEAHHAAADLWQRQFEAYPDAFFLYMTATPFRGAGQQIPREIVFEYDRDLAIEEGVIRPHEVIDAAQGENDDIEDIFRLVVHTVKLKIRENQALESQVFHQAMIMAKDAASAFQICGIYNAEAPLAAQDRAAVYVSPQTGRKIGGVTKQELQRNQENFNTHKIRTIIVVGCLIEGYDNPNVSVVGFATGKSYCPTFTQFIGRAIRRDIATITPAYVVYHSRLIPTLQFDRLDTWALQGDGEEEEEDEG